MRNTVAMHQIQVLDAWAALAGPAFRDPALLLGGRAEQFTAPPGVNSCLRIVSGGETIIWNITLPGCPVLGITTKEPLSANDFDRLRKALKFPDEVA